ncbi:uncharacterized protein LOC128244519 [Mya arenaria]|uniref:uncharacterized protein LOC128244519 n=1 Tax=Mya arenaria TaxID=6604 RepID=UPI0022E263C0|nr:uncharacterized protein LOC128244519 [Mya arenaria]
MLMGKQGVNVNQKTGYTPLHLAAQQGHEEVIELLIQGLKADPNIRDYSGKKAKQYLPNSASSRTQRKSHHSHLADSVDSTVATSISLRKTTPGENPVILRHKANKTISQPSDFRRVKSELISAPTDFRHVQSAGSSSEIGGFGELLVSSRLGSKTSTGQSQDGAFMRNAGNRRSNRESAIRSLIRASTGAVQRTVRRGNWGSTEDVNSDGSTPRSSPRNSAEPSPNLYRKSVPKDRDLMPPPTAPSRNKGRKPVHSISKESLHSEERKSSVVRQVSRSESEPNLGDVTQPSKTTFI